MFNTFLRKRINRYKGNKLVVEWAAEPEELIWENIGVFTSKTLFRILCFFALVQIYYY